MKEQCSYLAEKDLPGHGRHKDLTGAEEISFKSRTLAESSKLATKAHLFLVEDGVACEAVVDCNIMASKGSLESSGRISGVLCGRAYCARFKVPRKEGEMSLSQSKVVH